MARLGRVELETVDTLITAGIVVNRAEAIRWALARTANDRPTNSYGTEHGEIEEIKTESQLRPAVSPPGRPPYLH